MSVTPRAYGNANAMALLMAAFTEGDRRNRALGYWGAVGSAGAIVGQLLGRVLTTAFGWQVPLHVDSHRLIQVGEGEAIVVCAWSAGPSPNLRTTQIGL